MTVRLQPSDTDTLLSSLVDQHRRVRGIVEGLDDSALRRPVLPSGWSCAGMVQHLTYMTRFWFVDVMAGSSTGPTSPEDEFHVPADRSTRDLLEAYDQETRMAVDLVRDLPLDAAPAWWPDGLFGDWRIDTFHEVLLHVLVETSCHAGHLDAARELLDGRTWDYEHGRLSEPPIGGPGAPGR